jgi:hypothetical protein
MPGGKTEGRCTVLEEEAASWRLGGTGSQRLRTVSLGREIGGSATMTGGGRRMKLVLGRGVELLGQVGRLVDRLWMGEKQKRREKTGGLPRRIWAERLWTDERI